MKHNQIWWACIVDHGISIFMFGLLNVFYRPIRQRYSIFFMPWPVWKYALTSPGQVQAMTRIFQCTTNFPSTKNSLSAAITIKKRNLCIYSFWVINYFLSLLPLSLIYIYRVIINLWEVFRASEVAQSQSCDFWL